MSIQNKMHILLKDKSGEKDRKKDTRFFLSTGIVQLAREADLHESTVRRLFRKAVLNGGEFENEHWRITVTWEIIKGDRGFANRS